MTRIALALLLGSLASLAAAGAARADDAAPPAFAPPQGPALVLEHLTTRSLFDGREIRVRRAWQITFIPAKAGWQVDGTLVASEIDAPPSLASLARVERDRTGGGPFPIQLDSRGRIAGRDAAPGGADAAAFEEAAAVIVRSAAGKPHEAEARQFLRQLAPLAAAPIGSHWPESLFACAGIDRQAREFTLPDGETGTFSSEVTCVGQSGGSVPGAVERRVVTTIDASRHETVERWAFSAQ